MGIENEGEWLKQDKASGRSSGLHVVVCERRKWVGSIWWNDTEVIETVKGIRRKREDSIWWNDAEVIETVKDIRRKRVHYRRNWVGDIDG